MAPLFRFSALFLLSTAVTAHAAIEIEDRSLSKPSPRVVAPVTAPATTGTASISSAPLDNDNNNGAPEATGNSSWDTYSTLQSLQDEVGKLRGLIEQQGFLIEKLQNDLRTRYLDVDQRINELQDRQKQPVATNNTTSTNNETPASTGSSIEEERKAYLAAYDTFRSGGADKAIPPMLAFVKRYPQSSFTPGAYYWLGEFYLNAQTADPASAQKHFETVLNHYPEDARAPAALYKIGSILDLQGKSKDAADKMKLLLSKYPKSDEARLAEGYIKAYEAATKPVAPPASKPAAKPASGKP